MKLIKQSALLCWVIRVAHGDRSVASSLKRKNRIISSEFESFGAASTISEVEESERDLLGDLYFRILEDAMSMPTDSPTPEPTTEDTPAPNDTLPPLTGTYISQGLSATVKCSPV